ncbi:MAG TPA: hypothetical protein VNA25_09075, partial [Phycisphaerae bacterium]|nr:hypothetical protein [Phycisphaerae bacterium]
MRAWNGWYHVNGNTYGTWLRGDARGWREWKHHEHVDGDYRNPPPPGQSDEPLIQSRRMMRGRPIRLTPEQRRIAGQALAEKLAEMGIEVLVLSVDAVHYHFLARFADGQIRWRVGRAKKHASHVLSRHGLPGTVWAKRCRALPVRDRRHQLNAFEYIRSH